MASVNEKPYEVGYGKTPEHTRFQPGQSGNPSGRPKGAKNLATIVDKAINERVALTENGKRKTFSKLEVAVKQLVNKAASGDHKAMLQLLPLVQMIEGRAEAALISTPVIAEADQAVMGSISARLERSFAQEIPKEPEPIEKEKDNGDDSESV